MDRIVDETIKWIQGGGDPKFVTDFGGVLEDATQAAVGDVAREVGLGELCTGISPARIKFRLETPRFSESVSCTLDDIVGNIERFADSFQSGGFIGYQELLKPHNNRWGVEILTAAEVERRQSKAQDALRQEISTGRGFLSTSQCLEWSLYADFGGGETEVVNVIPVNEAFNFPDPSKPPPVGAPGQEWKCTQQRITTPGTAIAEGLERSLYSDLDYIINAQELTAYIGAIFDAAVNRLIKEGVKGVQGLKPSGSTPQTNCSDSRLDAQTRAACLQFQESQKRINEKTKDQEGKIEAAGKDAEEKLREAEEAFRRGTSTISSATSTESTPDGEGEL